MANRQAQEQERQAKWAELERTRLPELSEDARECLREMARVTTNPVGYYLWLVDDYAEAAAVAWPGTRPATTEEVIARWRRTGTGCLVDGWREARDVEMYYGASADEALAQVARRRTGGLLAAAGPHQPVPENTDGWE